MHLCTVHRCFHEYTHFLTHVCYAVKGAIFEGFSFARHQINLLHHPHFISIPAPQGDATARGDDPLLHTPDQLRTRTSVLPCATGHVHAPIFRRSHGLIVLSRVMDLRVNFYGIDGPIWRN